jgi:glycosyltransferase involved in cell wall biosynthesis
LGEFVIADDVAPEVEITMSLIIHAPNVHQGGGRTLLLALLNSLRPDEARQVILDDRMQLDRALPPDTRVKRVPATIAGRLMAEWQLRCYARTGDIVLCFGNLPPLLPLRARVVLYIQNRYHVERRGLGQFPAAVRYRLWFEHRWFDFGRRWVDEFAVQTPAMRRGLERCLGIQAKVMPFVGDAGGYSRRASGDRSRGNRKYDFIYVATGEKHKNHAKLVEAWCLLAAEGFWPKLCLTLSPLKAPELCQWIESQKQEHGLQIDVVGAETEIDVTSLYRVAGALIYPSLLESYGLPLIEARQAGLPIVAAETDYVRDVVDPEESFDPHSEFSIARAVKRFMGKDSDELGIVDAAAFVRMLTDKPEGEVDRQ